MKKLLFALLLSAASMAAYGQKRPVQIYCGYGSNDPVGARLCRALKSEINNSSRYQETDDDTTSRWTIRVSSVPVLDSSAQSLVVTVGTRSGEYFVSSGAFFTGADRVRESARDMVAHFDGTVTETEQRHHQREAAQ
jgi:hypothetical protein